MHDNIDVLDSQYFSFLEFDDIKFLIKRYSVEEVALKMYDAGLYKAGDRISDCSSYLKYGLYRHIFDESKIKKSLLEANFCRDRFCPVCNWRRARKLSKQYFNVFSKIIQDYKVRFLFLTLTIKNFHIKKFNKYYSIFSKGVSRFFDFLFKKRYFLGGVRSFECPLAKDGSLNLHCHSLILVDPSYFDEGYLTSRDLSVLFKRYAGLSYYPVVDIRKVRGSFHKGVLETLKYPFKHYDYLFLPASDFRYLYNAFKHKRFFGRFGIVTDYYRSLYGNKDIDDDLVFSDEELSNVWELVAELEYLFKNGDYVLVNKDLKKEK